MRVTSVLAAAFLTAGCLGGGSDDPLIGTWRLNIVKSKFDPGPPPQSATVVHSEDGDFIVTQVEAVGADGTLEKMRIRWKKDGHEYAVTGGGLDAQIARRIDDRTTECTWRNGGKVVAIGYVVVSRDGKVMTVGPKDTEGYVYEKQ